MSYFNLCPWLLTLKTNWHLPGADGGGPSERLSVFYKKFSYIMLNLEYLTDLERHLEEQ